MHIHRSLSLLFFLTVLLGCTSKQNIDLYVSKDGHPENAGNKEHLFSDVLSVLEKAHEIKAEDKSTIITIHLQPGTYYLNKPIEISPALNNLTIKGTGTSDVIIKGAEILNLNWEKHDGEVWVSKLEEAIDFDQLFANGQRQILARYPNYDESGGHWQGHAADALSTERVASWENPKGAFFHAMHRGEWGNFHYQIAGIDEAGNPVLEGGHQNNRPSEPHPEYRMVENVFELLDSPGEWFLDKENQQVYFWPPADVDVRNAVFEGATLENLITIKGESDNPVKGINIEGINFEHTRRTFMKPYEPLLRSDWTIYRSGAVLLENSEDCSISNCEFTNLGGNVIFVNGYNRNAEITNNHIYDCGASAICFVGDASAVRSPSFQYNEFVPINEMDTIAGPANDLYPSDCRVENNLIYRIGRVEKQVAGVQISMAMKIHVKNNSIYDVPRSGINVSEGTWGGHVIEYNDVFNTVLETSDHGSFNSWGRDRLWHPRWNVIDSLVHVNPQMPYWDAIHTTIIRNNRFRCDKGWDIDLDDGSSNYHIYNNLCLSGGIKLREGFYRTVENNIMVNNSFHPHVWFDNSDDVFTRNIVMTKYFPIRLAGWGKEVNYNLFPDSISLAMARENGTDKNSLYGNPLFKNPEKGDFTVEENSPAFTVGFKNFPMDQFGVQKPELKAIAKQPVIPELNMISFQKDGSGTKEWLGTILKNIETPEEQSASGLHSMDGVIVLKIKDESKLGKSGITEGDVIIGVDGAKIKDIQDLLVKYQENKWHGKLTLSIVRHQNEQEAEVKLK